MIAKSPFNVLFDELTVIRFEAMALEKQLAALCNEASRLDREILQEEFLPEVEAGREKLSAQALQEHGWTLAEYQAEIFGHLDVYLTPNTLLGEP